MDLEDYGTWNCLEMNVARDLDEADLKNVDVVDEVVDEGGMEFLDGR